MLFIMGVGLAKNIRTILVLRFFCGFFSSPALSIAGGTISDLWANSPSDQSIAVAIFCLCPFLGPVLWPIIGGFSAEYKNWQWAVSWVLLMFFGLVWPFAILAPETFKPVILARRARKRGVNVESQKVDMEFLKKVAKNNLLLPMVLLFTEPIVLIMSVYIAFIFVLLFGFFEAFPVIFRGVYHMDLGISGLTFIGVGIGLVLGVIFYVLLDLFYYFPKNPDGIRGKRDEEGKIIFDPPESKLLVGKVGAVCLPIALFWLGWTGKNRFNSLVGAYRKWCFLLGFGLILVFFAVVLYFAMSFPTTYCCVLQLLPTTLLPLFVGIGIPLVYSSMF
ncbi:conserved hypothetical protein [Lodderomyces elongisporus NRRL YB-4239]|uniref:Major facilitator superfamily (MFS) profile domain-containing protein n=1 Tax=Lodderomyces elongisporus (strain ATCC 11503 / CBS 2605 / JCM 1781 / NBRC 1676 / NRRL YB-4239) TaxID=379508 RepID=A5E183_LODEL|nr:conserved hypothetical protein [Lodderomyces elongisporus NRRL YB-4239]